jgi:hypothetical protein
MADDSPRQPQGRARSNIKWSNWLKVNCPDISQRTANLYKQVAKHKHRFKNAGNTVASLKRDDHDLSLRDALKLIPPDATRVQARAKANAERAARETAVEPEPAPKSPTIDAILPDLAPDELFTAVTTIWDREQIEKLAILLAEHMRSLKQAAA